MLPFLKHGLVWNVSHPLNIYSDKMLDLIKCSRAIFLLAITLETATEIKTGAHFKVFPIITIFQQPAKQSSISVFQFSAMVSQAVSWCRTSSA